MLKREDEKALATFMQHSALIPDEDSYVAGARDGEAIVSFHCANCEAAFTAMLIKTLSIVELEFMAANKDDRTIQDVGIAVDDRIRQQLEPQDFASKGIDVKGVVFGMMRTSAPRSPIFVAFGMSVEEG
jgi:hypothetical protein